jgi:hypothetical protein
MHKITGTGSYRLQYPDGQEVLIPGISSIYIVFILNQSRHLLTVPGDQYFQYNSILLVYDWYYMQVC